MEDMQEGAGWYQITGIPPEAQTKTNKQKITIIESIENKQNSIF